VEGFDDSFVAAVGVGCFAVVGAGGSAAVGAVDAGIGDFAAADAGVVDAGVVDAGAADAVVADAGAVDAGIVDAGVVHAGVVDAGVSDAGAVDAGVVDAGVVDAGAVDTAVEGSVFADVATVVAAAVVVVPVQLAADSYYTALVMAQQDIAGLGYLPVGIQQALQPMESNSVSGCYYKSSAEALAQCWWCQPLAGERTPPGDPRPG